MENRPETKTILRKNKRILHLKGLDGVTTESETRTIISEKLTKSGKQNATLIMEENKAVTELLESGKIRKNWMVYV